MWSLFFSVLPLAIGAMVTPTLFALQVLVVSGPKWSRNAVGVLIGAGVVFAIYFALILGGMSQLPDANSGQYTYREYLIEIGVALVVIAVSVWLLMPHKDINQKMKSKVEVNQGKASPWLYTGIAAYMTVTDFSTLAILLPALHDVTRAPVHVYFKAFVVLFLFVMVMMPVLLPPGLVRLGGERSVRLLHNVYDWVMGHQLQVMGGVALFIGLVLLSRGVQGAF